MANAVAARSLRADVADDISDAAEDALSLLIPQVVDLADELSNRQRLDKPYDPNDLRVWGILAPQADVALFREDFGVGTNALWLAQHLKDGCWRCTVLRSTSPAGGTLHVLYQDMIRHAMVPVDTTASGTVVYTGGGGWGNLVNAGVWGGNYDRSQTAGNTVTWTTPAGVTKVGIRSVLLGNNGLVKVEVDGSATRATLLPTAQELVTSGAFPNTILIANGGSLAPTDRCFNGHETNVDNDRRWVFADDLTAGVHTLKLTVTGYENNAGASAYLNLSAFLYGTPTTALVSYTDRLTAATILARGPYLFSGDSAYEYAMVLQPTGTVADPEVFIGNSHGYDNQTALVCEVDDGVVVPADNQMIVAADKVEIIRSSNLRHPLVGGGTTTIAAVTTTYTIEGEGLRVRSVFDWVGTGKAIGQAYAGMQPGNHAAFTVANSQNGPDTLFPDDPISFASPGPGTMLWMYGDATATLGPRAVLASYVPNAAEQFNDWENTPTETPPAFVGRRSDIYKMYFTVSDGTGGRPWTATENWEFEVIYRAAWVTDTDDYGLDQAAPTSRNTLAVDPSVVDIGINQIVDLQAELDDKVDVGTTYSRTGGLLTDFGTAAGVDTGTTSGKVPVLGVDNKIDASLLPAVAFKDFLGEVANEAGMLALVGDKGDWCTRLDVPADYTAIAEPLTSAANWRQITAPGGGITTWNGNPGPSVNVDTDDLPQGGTNKYYATALVNVDAPNVTLSAAAQALFSLTGQALDVDDVAENTVLAGLSSGTGKPAFRAVTAAMLPVDAYDSRFYTQSQVDTALLAKASVSGGNSFSGQQTVTVAAGAPMVIAAGSGGVARVLEIHNSSAALTFSVSQDGTIDGIGTNITGMPQSGVTSLVSDLAAKVPTSRTISTTAPLTGGGDLSANRTLAVSAATDIAAGVVELATLAEADAQADTTRAVTPADLVKRISTAMFGAKGQLLVATGSGTVSNLNAGTDTHVLTADSAQATGVKWAAAPGGGTGFTPPWHTLIIGAHGDCNPDTLLNLAQAHGTASITPTDLGTTTARICYFRPPANITINKIRFYGTGNITNIFRVAIYNGDTLARLTAELPFSTALSVFGSAGSGLALALTAGQLYFIAFAANAASTSFGPLTVGSPINTDTTGKIAVLPKSFPGNMDADVNAMGTGYAQFTVTAGALPATAATITAAGNWSKGFPAFWLDNSNA